MKLETSRRIQTMELLDLTSENHIRRTGRTDRPQTRLCTTQTVRTVQPIRHISAADVVKFSVKCEEGKIIEYRADLKIVFGIEGR